MLNRLKTIIIREQFEPGILGLFTNPFYIARKGLLEHIRSLAPNITGKTLDVGCGTKPYEKYFNHSQYIGLEVNTGIDSEKKRADFYYDGKKFPFEDDEFDSVVTNQVLEHVFTPDLFLSEINRVLKISGNLLLTVPFVWDEHEQPFDFARYSSFGAKSLFEKNGFEIIEHRKSLNDFRVIIQLINAYLYKTSLKRRPVKLLVNLFLIAPVTILGIFISKILPKNNDLYLDNIIFAKKKNDI